MDITPPSQNLSSLTTKISPISSLSGADSKIPIQGQIVTAQVVSASIIQSSGLQPHQTSQSSIAAQTLRSDATISDSKSAPLPVNQPQVAAPAVSNPSTTQATPAPPLAQTNTLERIQAQSSPATQAAYMKPDSTAGDSLDEQATIQPRLASASAKLQSVYGSQLQFAKSAHNSNSSTIPTPPPTKVLNSRLIEAQIKFTNPILGQAPLKILTDRIIQSGDRLALRQLPDGTLNLLGKTSLAAEVLSRTPADKLSKFIIPLSPLPQPRQQANQLIHAQLAAVLPKAKASQNIVNHLNQLQQAMDKLAPTERSAWLGQQLFGALDQLNQSLPNFSNKITTTDLAAAISNNGTFLENRLFKNLISGNTITADDLSILKRSDQKALLTNVVEAAQAQAASMVTPSTNAAILTALNGRGAMDTPFAQLLASLLNSRASHLQNNETKLTQAKLITQIRQLAQNSLSKIQLNQLQSLLASLDSETTQSSAQFDISFRYHNELQQIQAQLTQQEVTITEDSGEKNSPKLVKQWCLVLSLELENIGKISIELTLINNRLKTRIWSASEASIIKINQTKERLVSLLEKESIHIDNIEIIHGEAPSQQMKFNYNLVDVKT